MSEQLLRELVRRVNVLERQLERFGVGGRPVAHGFKWATADGTVSTTNTSYEALTGGPSISVTIPAGYSALLVLVAAAVKPGAGDEAFMTVELTGTTPITPTDARALRVDESAGWIRASVLHPFISMTAGSYTVAARYRSGDGGTVEFAHRLVFAWAI